MSKQGIRADLQGVAIVKVGGTEDAIRAAAQRFLHQQDEIEEFTREVLAGALRSIVGRLTVEEIIRDRAAFATAVAEEAEHSMTNQGLVLDTFQLQDILAEGSYLQDLGRPEAARVLKDAAIAEARARQQAEQERLLAEEAIAEANRNLALKQAGIQAEIDAAKAKSAAAGPLAQAERDQAILAEQQKVAERNAELKQRQLDTEVRKPADADRYKVEQEAEARQQRGGAAAPTRSGRPPSPPPRPPPSRPGSPVRASGPAGPRWPRRTRSRAPRRVRPSSGGAPRSPRRSSGRAGRGRRDPGPGPGRGRGDGEQGRGVRRVRRGRRAGPAGQVLPQVVEAASAPIGAIDKMTVISTDGASSLTKSVAGNVAQGLQLGSDLTGIDLPGLLARLGPASSLPATAPPP